MEAFDAVGIDTITLQERLQNEIFGLNLRTLTREQRAEQSNIMFRARGQEITEAQDEYKSLPWKPEREDGVKIREELIDIQHFLNNLYLIWGIPNEVFRDAEYLRKWQKNFERGSVHQKDSHEHSKEKK